MGHRGWVEVEHCALIDVSNPGRIVNTERDKWGRSEEAKHGGFVVPGILIEGNLEWSACGNIRQLSRVILVSCVRGSQRFFVTIDYCFSL